MFGHNKGPGSVGAGQDNASAWGEVLVGLSSNEELSARVDAKHAIKLFL